MRKLGITLGLVIGSLSASPSFANQAPDSSVAESDKDTVEQATAACAEVKRFAPIHRAAVLDEIKKAKGKQTYALYIANVIVMGDQSLEALCNGGGQPMDSDDGKEQSSKVTTIAIR